MRIGNISHHSCVRSRTQQCGEVQNLAKNRFEIQSRRQSIELKPKMENISWEESDEGNVGKIRYKPLLESGNMNPKIWQNNNQLPWIPLLFILALLASRFSPRPALSKLWPSINPPFRFGQALRSGMFPKKQLWSSHHASLQDCQNILCRPGELRLASEVDVAVYV
jgi:hypothetical protein